MRPPAPVLEALTTLYWDYTAAHPTCPLPLHYTAQGELGLPTSSHVRLVAWALRTARLTPVAAADVLEALADVKARWVAALRAGHYTQNYGFLCLGRGTSLRFSALGVLCDLLDPAAWQPVPGAWHWRWQDVVYSVPPAVCVEIDFAVSQVADIQVRNDEVRATFPALADYIEEHL